MRAVGVCLFAILLLGCSRKNGETPEMPVKPSTTKEWLQLLKSSDAAERVAAVKALAHRIQDSKEVLPAIINATEDKSDDVKRVAGIVVWANADKTRPILIQKLKANEAAAPELPHSPNPARAPIELSSVVDLLVGIDLWYAGRLMTETINALHDDDPQFRLVAAEVFLAFPKPDPREGPPPFRLLRKEERATVEAALGDANPKVQAAAKRLLDLDRQQ